MDSENTILVKLYIKVLNDFEVDGKWYWHLMLEGKTLATTIGYNKFDTMKDAIANAMLTGLPIEIPVEIKVPEES